MFDEKKKSRLIKNPQTFMYSLSSYNNYKTYRHKDIILYILHNLTFHGLLWAQLRWGKYSFKR